MDAITPIIGKVWDALDREVSTDMGCQNCTRLGAADCFWCKGRTKRVVEPLIRSVVAEELDRLAFDLERRSDNVVLTSDRGGIEFMATLRETAERVRAQSAELRAGE